MTRSDADVIYTPTLGALLDALSDATRRQIVYRLARQPGLCNSFGDLGSKTKLSYHYSVLRHAGLTRTERQGVWRMMFLRLEEVEDLFPGLLTAVLKGSGSEQPAPDESEPPAGFVDEDCACVPETGSKAGKPRRETRQAPAAKRAKSKV